MLNAAFLAGLGLATRFPVLVLPQVRVAGQKREWR
jgi:hypothetical protein